MNLVGAILVLSILILANYWFRRSVVYPPFLFCAMWLFDFIVISLNLIEVFPLHAITINVVVVGAILFSAGGALSFLVPRTLIATRLVLIGKAVGSTERPKASGDGIKYFIVLLLALGVCLTAHALWVIASGAGGGATGAYFAVARNATVQEMNEGHESSHWYSYVTTWGTFAVVLFQLEQKDRLFWSAFAITLVACVFSGGRGGILFLVSAVTCIYLVKEERETFRIALRAARWPVASFLVLFVALTFINKDTSGMTNSVFAYAEDSLIAYIVGPVAALDHVLIHLLDYRGLPNHTFQFFLRIATSLGITSYTPPPTLDEWVNIPFGTNVYTVFKFFIIDFGIYSILPIMLVIGFLHTLLFRKAHTNSNLALYMFSLTTYPVLMSIFDDAYSRFGQYASALLCGVAYMTIRSISWCVFAREPRTLVTPTET